MLRVMTRLGWLKDIGIYATEGVSQNDLKTSQRAGALLPLPPQRRPKRAAPQPYPQWPGGHGRTSFTARVRLAHVRLELAVGSDGAVSAQCRACAAPLALKPAKVGCRPDTCQPSPTKSDPTLTPTGAAAIAAPCHAQPSGQCLLSLRPCGRGPCPCR